MKATIIQFGQARQGAAPATDGNSSNFQPYITRARRVFLQPLMKVRLMRKFYELGHDVRKIARDERVSEAILNQCIREKYWQDRKDSDTGPIPTSTLRRAARMERTEAVGVLQRKAA